jgi:hypothetical protein
VGRLARHGTESVPYSKRIRAHPRHLWFIHVGAIKTRDGLADPCGFLTDIVSRVVFYQPKLVIIGKG